MNVIVSNRQKEIIDNANIDAIKDLNGLFNVNDLINKFKNYFFSKMILDATSIIDFASREVLTTLANEIGAEKLIILLPSNPEPPLEFKKLLIELRIFNFTNNIQDVVRFIEKPNTYEDAIKLLDDAFDSDVYVDNSIKEEDANSDKSVEETTHDTNSNNKASLGDILSSLSVGNTVNEPTSDDYHTDEQDEEDTNEKNMVDDIINKAAANNNVSGNTSGNMFLISDDFNNTPSVETEKPKKIVIGIKNVTNNAGSTSLIYMLHKMATVNMKKNVLSIEIGKNDFRLFRDSKMVSTGESDVKELVDNSDAEVIFIDLNDSNNLDICNDVLYLVEPSTIKLNSLMATNKSIFQELKGKKVLLVKSLLSNEDIHILESEAGLEFFDSIEPLNDRIFNDSISKLLNLLGIN